MSVTDTPTWLNALVGMGKRGNRNKEVYQEFAQQENLTLPKQDRVFAYSDAEKCVGLTA
jgi:hypothetical protein